MEHLLCYICAKCKKIDDFNFEDGSEKQISWYEGPKIAKILENKKRKD